MILLSEFKKENAHGTVILTSDSIEDALELYSGGADYVILPHFLGGDYVSSMIDNYSENFQEMLKEKLSHITQLKERQSQGHKHPKRKRN